MISCSDEHEVIGTGWLANAAIPKEEGDSRSYSYSQIYISTLPTRPLLVAVGGPSLFLHRNGSQTLPPINVNVFVHRWSQRTISDTESQQAPYGAEATPMPAQNDSWGEENAPQREMRLNRFHLLTTHFVIIRIRSCLFFVVSLSCFLFSFLLFLLLLLVTFFVRSITEVFN